MKIRYIGNFPPPYGGVTIKNKLLYEELSKSVKIRHFRKPKFLPGTVYYFCNMMLAIIPRQTLIIGISSKGGKSRLLTKLLYRFNRKSMRRSLYFMMGGTEAERIVENADEIQWYGQYSQVYVETGSMAERLKNAGLTNISVYPNCRKRPALNRSQVNKTTLAENEHTDRLKCVYFSYIEEMKGVDLILEAAANLPHILFTFWGNIADEYVTTFRKAVEKIPNVSYQGVFTGNSEEKYQELAKYDVLLLPTKWKTEGVPGIIAEAKVSGITMIVSDASYNSELVHHMEDGIVLNENTASDLKSALEKLDVDRELLKMLKAGSRKSAESYYFDRYGQDILNLINPAGGGISQSGNIQLEWVFFSLIDAEKGVDVILQTAGLMPFVQFGFWGEIATSYKNEFNSAVENLNNVSYYGVFKGTSEETYCKLSEYDVLLLPTRWLNEGVPGIIVESKIAGIPAIVSDINYNGELVHNKIDGFVLHENDVAELSTAIQFLYNNRIVLEQMKEDSYKSAERFYADNYVPGIVAMMMGGYLVPCHYMVVCVAVQLLLICREVAVG